MPGVTPKRRTEPMGHEVPAIVRAQTARPLEEMAQEVTGVHTGEALKQMRAARPTEQRFEHIEGRIDGLSEHVNTVAVAVAELKVLPDLVRSLEKAVDRTLQRDHVTFTSQVQVDTAGAIAKIEDTADAKKTRRALLAKIVAGVAALLTSGAGLHWLLEKL